MSDDRAEEKAVTKAVKSTVCAMREIRRTSILPCQADLRKYRLRGPLEKRHMQILPSTDPSDVQELADTVEKVLQPPNVAARPPHPNSLVCFSMLNWIVRYGVMCADFDAHVYWP